MSFSSKEVRFKINKLLNDMQAIAQKGFTAESRAQFDAISNEVDSLEQDAQRLEAMEQRTSAAERLHNSFERSPRPSTADGGLNRRSLQYRAQNGVSDDEANYEIRSAFTAYLRGGIHSLNSEQRDLLTTSDGAGGAFIPQIFSGILADALKFYGPIATYVRRKDTDNNGAPMKVSLDNDTGNGLYLLGTEGSYSPQETDPALQAKLLGVDTFTAGLVKVSFQELEDSAFDLDAFIRDKMGLRYGRGLEQVTTNGKDSAGTALPNSSGLLAGLPVGTTTGTVAAGIGWDDLTTLSVGSIDPAYLRPDKAVWVMNSSTRAYLVGLKDGFGRPYFTPDPSQDAPFSRILGYNIILNQAMPNMGANATPIAFGDPSSAYLLRTDGAPRILRLQERYADTLEQGFYLFGRAGGTSIVMSGAPAPMALLKQAAS